MTKVAVKPGIYFGMAEADYFAAEGLSCSGMKQLSVSALNYWHHNVNPDYVRPEETKEQRFGKAVHCKALEPERFANCFAPKMLPDSYPGALVTADDLRGFCEANGLPKTAKKKQELIERIVASGLKAFIWDIEEPKYLETHAGKTFLGRDEFARIDAAAKVLAGDDAASQALTGGMPEVSFFVRDLETGVMLKARMDYVKPSATIDVKTFSNSRGKPIEKTVFDAIYYERYYLQCFMYHSVRELARQQLAAGEIQTFGNVSESWLKEFVETESHAFGFVFIESDEPFDLRTVYLKRSEGGGDLNVYWLAAATQMAEMTQLYAECRAKFGDRPWRESRPPHILLDTDLPQLMFA